MHEDADRSLGGEGGGDMFIIQNRLSSKNSEKNPKEQEPFLLGSSC